MQTTLPTSSCIDIVSDFIPLPLGNSDLILGYEWLLSLGATHELERVNYGIFSGRAAGSITQGPFLVQDLGLSTRYA